MTVPSERTRAVLWAGGLLVQINDDACMPLDIRLAAHNIARHFPTVSDVASMALLSTPGIGGAMFERPEHVAGWEDGCLAGPLKYSTRLRCPDEPSDSDTDDDDQSEGQSYVDEAISRLHEARVIYEECMQTVYLQLLRCHPELSASLESLGSTAADAAKWLCTPNFDDNTKTGADMFGEGRGQEVIDRVLQSAESVYR